MGKKKKKQASVDSAQLVKGGVICAVVVGAIYFFNNLGGGGTGSNATVALLAPQNNADDVAQPIQNGQGENNHNQDRLKPNKPEKKLFVEPTPSLKPPMIEKQPPPLQNMFDKTGKRIIPDVLPAGGSQATAEMRNIEVPSEPLELPELTERVMPSVVRISFKSSAGNSVGTGFVVSQSGLVVTSLHSLEGADGAYVEFSDGSSANVQGYKVANPQYNIAVLQIEVPEGGLKILPLLNQVPLKGAQIIAFGAPPISATEGTISAVFTSNEMRSKLQLPFSGSWLQTSTPIPPTISGGPVVDRFGQVVAVNVLQLTNGENQSFALAASDVLRFINEAQNRELNKLTPSLFKGLSTEIKRKTAKDIIGTDRGNQLLGEVKEIGFSQIYQSEFDSTGIVKNTVNVQAKRAISKSEINLLIDDFGEDVPIMLVTLNAIPQQKRGIDSLKVFVQAVLVGIDPEERSSNKFVTLWKGKKTELGSFVPENISQAIISRTIGSDLAKFFNKFRTAQSKAKRLSK